MLAEYALVPDIFDRTSYSVQETCDICLRHLKQPLLEEALVRDLRNGEWLAYVQGHLQRWHPRATELLKKLFTQKRLRPFRSCLAESPAGDAAWCDEAVASHQHDPLNGIIASWHTAESHAHVREVASIENLTNAPWWQARSPSVRLNRNTAEYLRHLGLVFSHANSLMFIDAHLDPSRRNYGEFIQLIERIAATNQSALIEVHRVCYLGSGPGRDILDNLEWERRFRENLRGLALPPGITIEVYIWDDFHDRYLITDLVGILIPNGFDVTSNSRDVTTWSRIGRKERDDIQREFDPAANRHHLRHRFRL